MGTAARRCAPPDDTAGLRTALRDTVATLGVLRSGPRPDPAAVAALEGLADSIEGAGFRIAVAAGEEVGRDAETFAEGFAAGRSARPRVPRQRADRHGLRCVPDEPGDRYRLRALSTAVAVAAMVLIAVPVPHHHAAASPPPAASAVTASRPVSPVRALDLAKSAARTGGRRDRL
jgi:hypothetical protein